jgi:hypothetical protein
MENQVAGIVERIGKDAQSITFPTGHEQVEQGRTSAVFFHQQELAGQTADQFGGDSQQ